MACGAPGRGRQMATPQQHGRQDEEEPGDRNPYPALQALSSLSIPQLGANEAGVFAIDLNGYVLLHPNLKPQVSQVGVACRVRGVKH